MAEIRIENVTKLFGKFTAVNNVSMTIEDQEFVVLLGPSGCGKTTLLRAIAGLGMADAGRICIGSRDVTYLPPRERKMSMVFQSYAIFPHMNVFDNIAFGLKMNKFPKVEIEQRVREAAEMLHIEDTLTRFPNAMSGGQRQRVAVARAIAMKSEVLLMDEPLSNLDALLRLEMRAELKRLLQEIKTTTLYVTHDQIEALSMGDRIAVMKSGEIQQYEHPNQVYDRPVNRFVGSFIGTPPMNFFHGQVQAHPEAHEGSANGQVLVKIGDYALIPAAEIQPRLKPYDGKPILIGIRAENMQAFTQPEPGAFQVTVSVVEPLGSQNLLTVQIGADVVKVSTHPSFETGPNQEIWLRFPADKIRFIDPDSGQALYSSI